MVPKITFIETIYIYAALITALESYILSAFIYFRNNEVSVNKSYSLMGLFIGTWSFLLFVCHVTPDREHALIVNRWLHCSSIFIAISFYYFTLNLLNNHKQKLLIFGLICAIVLSILCLFTSTIVMGMAPKFDFRLWPEPGPLYQVYLLYFSFFSYYSLFLIFKAYRLSSGHRRILLKYVFISLFIGFAGGSTNFAYFYNIHMPRLGNFFVFLYVLILAYAIVKYQDIRIVLLNTLIFLGIYTLVLGVPFYVYFSGFKLIALIIMGVLASSAPIVYSLLRRQAENKILEEQHKYQSTLLEASKRLSKLKTEKDIAQTIIKIIYAAIGLKDAGVYLKEEKNYKLIEKIGDKSNFPLILPQEHSLISTSVRLGTFIVQELQHKSKYNSSEFKETVSFFKQYTGSVVVSVINDETPMALLILGEKQNNSFFSERDLNVLNIISVNTALALENARFYEDIKRTQQQLFNAEKMATIGTMADGLSHQINNRFHAMGFVAGDALDTIKMNKDLEMSDKLKEIMAELEKALNRVQENVTQGGEIVQGLLKYTRKGEQGMSPVDVDTVISSAYEMAQFKIKTYQMILTRDYDKDLLPKVKGNSTQLQEVFFNLIDNAYDAMMQRKNELTEPNYQAKLIIHAEPKEHFLEMIFEDNGMGVKEEDVQKLFTPFFTTKLSSKKGTGLGLYVIRKIIEDNHLGTVEFLSKHMIGTQMKIRLPLAEQ